LREALKTKTVASPEIKHLHSHCNDRVPKRRAEEGRTRQTSEDEEDIELGNLFDF